jgi:sugar-specific transcriptional regulator TrmB
VDVQESSPKRFWAISTETAARHFEQEYTHRVNTLADALDTLAASERSTEQRGVWTVTGRDTITERIVDFVSSAETEVVYMTIENLLTDETIERLSAASDRGVSIQLAEMSDQAERRIHAELPDAAFFESIWE